MCKQKERIHVATHHSKPPSCFAENAGRKSPTELGDVPGLRLCQCITVVVPMALTMLVRQQERRANVRWVERWSLRSSRSGRFTGLCLSSSAMLLISCQFHLPGQRWRKMIAFFQQTLGRQHWEEAPQHSGFTSSGLSATQQLRI